MTDVAVSLPDDLRAWAADRAAEEQLADAGDFVATLLRRDRDEVAKLRRLQTAIDVGRASPSSERTIEDIIASGRQRHAAR